VIVRIVWGRVKPGTWDKYEETYNRLLDPTVGDVPGLRHRLLVRNTKDPDDGYSISYWESEKDIAAYKQSELYKETLSELEDCFVGDWSENAYELRSESPTTV